jgi:ABC-type multidrug transport system permease subunit
LDGLDLIEVVVVQPASSWARWTEGLMINVLASAIFAGLAFFVGLSFADSTVEAHNKTPICVQVSAPEKAE